MELNIIGLAHIGIKVRDMEKSLAFYRDLLGFTLTDEVRLDNGTLLAFLNAGDCKIELIQSAQPVERSTGMIEHIAVTVHGIDALVAGLQGKVKFEGPVMTMPNLLGGVKNVFFSGPDGEGIEFFEYLT